MRLGYFADGPWSHRALERISSDARFEVAFIVPRFDVEDPVLRDWAKKLNVDFLPLSNVNTPKSISLLASYKADLFVSMSFNQILKREFLDVPPLGVINCHAGELPFYRGRNILNWALINDAPHFGVTVHYVDEGIDTGDVILQTKEPISDLDTYRTLLDRAINVCSNLLFESLGRIADGSATRRPQANIHPIGFYCSRRIAGDEWIDWNWTSRRIFNFVRAITYPGPCARTMLGDTPILIERVSLIADAPIYLGTPGEIVSVAAPGVTVKTGDSTVVLNGFKAEGEVRLRIGKRFRSIAEAEIERLKSKIAFFESEIEQLREGTKK
jgi:methionyl-tRNA formyltransferase